MAEGIKTIELTVREIVKIRKNFRPLISSCPQLNEETPLASDRLDIDEAWVRTKTAASAPDHPVDLEVGEVASLAFDLHVPLRKTLHMEAAFLMPSEAGRTFLHVEKVEFGREQGENVLCTNLDLVKAYATSYEMTTNISQFGEVRIDTWL